MVSMQIKKSILLLLCLSLYTRTPLKILDMSFCNSIILMEYYYMYRRQVCNLGLSSVNNVVLPMLFLLHYLQFAGTGAMLIQKYYHSGTDSSQQTMSKCDLFQGSWVYDDASYPLYNSSDCSFMETEFDCQGNGRPDTLYLHYTWHPSACDLPK